MRRRKNRAKHQRPRFPDPKNAVALGQVYHRLALSFGPARDQDAAVPLPLIEKEMTDG